MSGKKVALSNVNRRSENTTVTGGDVTVRGIHRFSRV
jgi:hypothetical protein